MEEICTYTPDPDNPNHTLFRQDMRIKAFVWGVSGQIEHLAMESFKKNALVGRAIMMEAVQLIPAALSGRFDPKTRTMI